MLHSPRRTASAMERTPYRRGTGQVCSARRPWPLRSPNRILARHLHFRLAARAMARKPEVTALALVSLALAIGFGTAGALHARADARQSGRKRSELVDRAALRLVLACQRKA